MEFHQTNHNQGEVNNHAGTPSPAEILRRFTHHTPKGDQAERYEQVRAAALTLAILFTDRCPPSRELSLALTNLEQAVFWANAAIARHE